MKIQKSVIGIIVLALSTLFLISDSTFQIPLGLEKANELMYFQIIGKDVSATTDDDSDGNDESSTDESSTDESSTDESSTDESSTDESSTDESSTDESSTDESSTDESSTDESNTDESNTDESSNEESSAPNFRNPTVDGKSITDFDQSNFQPFSELEVKNSNDESLSSNFIDPSNDGTPPSDSGNSNLQSLSDLLEVESTTKTPSSTIKDQSNFQPFSELEVKNSNDESLSSNFIDPSNDGTPPSDSGNSNLQSLSDLLEVESTTKTPSSSIDNQLVTRQLPNVESFGSDSNLGLKQLLPADSIIKGGIEKLRRSPTSTN